MIFLKLSSSFDSASDIVPGLGILSKSGGNFNGFFFFTKNSSVVLIFSFLKIFPALPHESKNKKSINVNKLIFFSQSPHNKNNNSQCNKYICNIKNKPMKIIIVQINEIRNCFEN